MDDNSSERALLAILALEPEEGSPLSDESQLLAEGPLPSLDARVEMYLRAMHDGDFLAPKVLRKPGRKS